MFYSYRANVCLRVENWEQAIQDSTKAIELDPHANTYYNRGVAYVNSGDLEQAIADFEQYLELAPDAPDREEVITWIGEMKSGLAP